MKCFNSNNTLSTTLEAQKGFGCFHEHKRQCFGPALISGNLNLGEEGILGTYVVLYYLMIKLKTLFIYVFFQAAAVWRWLCWWKILNHDGCSSSYIRVNALRNITMWIFLLLHSIFLEAYLRLYGLIRNRNGWGYRWGHLLYVQELPKTNKIFQN